MLIQCDEIQNESGEYHELYEKYSQTYADKILWYKSIYNDFAAKLKSESQGNHAEEYQVKYEILAKKELLNVTEPLIKLALSRFSYGPSKEFFDNNKFDTSFVPRDKKINYGKSWLENTTEFAVLAEILAHVLMMTKTEYDFDLKVLANDRDKRNAADHAGTRIRCVTLIRKYESIRNLLAFLDPANRDLPHFQDDIGFDYDCWIEEPCKFSFKETATVLIVDSVHDIAKGYRSVIANQPWDLVIDFDGYSKFGGLLSSVEHNSIRKELLVANKSDALPNLDRMQTMWYCCGEYLLTDYHGPNRVDILGKRDFLDQTNRFQKMITLPLKKVLQKVTNLQRFINIVVLSDDGRIVNGTIDALRELNFDDYFVSWVGVAESDVEKDFDNNEGNEFCQIHFYHYECPICSFFRAFYEYRENWPPRSSIRIDFALPTSDGSYISLNENMRNNLSPYFEVLYRDWDSVHHPDDAFTDPFQKGGRATWKDIASGEALPLDDAKEEKVRNKIKTITGRAQEESPQKNLFFVKHKAGIGGTTFVKQVAWKLHNDMAVLEVKRYDEKKTFSLLQDVYDNIINKNPILLVAEDTLPNLEAMCDAFLVYMKSRRCALIIACRENNGLCGKYANSQIEPFTQLRSIDTLKRKFCSISPLSKMELEEKLQNFDSAIISDIRTPFIIGLYFLEKEFRIESYISKVLDNSLLPTQKDMIALLALCDMYDSKELPSSFINRILGYNLRTRSSLIQSCPGAESLICRGRNSEGIEVYYFKHKLLSEQYFLMYTQRGGLGRYELTKKLIEFAAKCQVKAEQKCVSDTLIDVLIRNKETDNLSQLLADIAIPESQRSLVAFLAEQFKPSADTALCEIDTEYAESNSDNGSLYLVSHAYAHLGKLYTNPPENYDKAVSYLSLAERYMPYNDKRIFHMYGKVLYRQLCKKWRDDLENFDSNGIVPLSDYDETVDKSFGLFDKTSECGDVQYGITGQLDLLYEYLKYVYRIKKISTTEDLKKLSPKQMTYHTLFIDTLDVAKQYDDFDTEAVASIQRKENQLRSDVLMGDCGKTIEYYQNEYDKQKSSNNTEYMLSVLQGLVSARIQKAKERYYSTSSKQLSFYQMVSDPKTLFDQLETLLPGLYNQKGYSAYVKRTALFRHWFQLAKLLDHPINEALIKVKYWIDSENEIRRQKNPEPFYYQETLLCLEKIEGGDCDSELQAVRSTIARIDRQQQFDPKRGRLNKIRDILVNGTGMGKLLNVSDCSTSAEIADRITMAKKSPVALSGNIETAQYWGAEILVFDPPTLKNLKVLSEIGKMAKNTLSDQQINHKVKCFAGFSVLEIMAVGDSVKDQDTGEPFDIATIISKMRAGECLNNADPDGKKRMQQANTEHSLNAPNQNKHPKKQVVDDIDRLTETHIPVHLKERQGIFFPSEADSRLWGSDECSGWINGKIDGINAGISIAQDLSKFGSDQLDRHGGIRKIFRELSRKEQLPCVIINEQSDNGSKRYKASLFMTGSSLADLLNYTPLPVQPVSTDTVSTKSPLTEETNKNKEKITVTLNSIDQDACIAMGCINRDGEKLEIEIPLNGKAHIKKAKKAYAQKEAIAVYITDTGEYSLDP